MGAAGYSDASCLGYLGRPRTCAHASNEQDWAENCTEAKDCLAVDSHVGGLLIRGCVIEVR